MSFVPGFKYDVFVSYAQVNDQERWVSRFQEKLSVWLNDRLGRKDAAGIFFDCDTIQGNDPLTPKIENALRQCAALVLVLSEGYLKSPWCQQELDLFSRLVSQTPGRIFLVQYDKVEIQKKPVPVRELIGYKFHSDDREPLPLKPDDAAYERVLNSLRSQLAAKLQELKLQAEASPPSTPTGRTGKGPASAASPDGSVAVSGPAVYLAEVPDGLSRQYRELEMFLTQSLFEVRPCRYFHYAPPGFAAEIDRHLDECLVFVQLLGQESAASSSKPEFPAGYEAWLLDRARQKGLTVLRWRSRELAADIADAGHRRFVCDHEVTACDIEEFKHMVVKAVEQRQLALRLESRRPTATNDAKYSLLFKTTECDKSITYLLTKPFIDDPNVGFYVIEDEESLVEVAACFPCDGVIIVYGACPSKWLKKSVLEFMQLVNRPGAPACAVYLGPPDDIDKQIGAKCPKLRFIRHTDQLSMSDFVKSLPGVAR